MSYDLDLYLSKATPLDPPAAGDGGLFNAEPPARCEDDDIPDGYHAILGKRRRWLHRLHIEGAPKTDALAAFEDWLTATISRTNGVLIDEQSGRFQGAKTSGPLPEAQPKADIKLGEMSFFFEDVEGFHRNGLAQVLQIIAKVLPQAMPTRFGQYEPLQGRVENGDTGPLLAAFAEDPDQFLKAKTPFAHIFLSLPCKAELAKWHPKHFIRKELLVGTMRFELRPKAFDDPRLLPLFSEISAAIGVFYSEIRDRECPVRAWFWHGLPNGPVRAFCLGRKYADLWPEAVARGQPLKGDTILVAPNRLQPALPEPPRDLCDPGERTQPGIINAASYPARFPFTRPDT